MHLDAPSLERRDKNTEQPTVENVNAALARLGLVRGMDITVKTLTHDSENWIAHTYESAAGSTSLTDGETVTFEKSSELENADAVALKLWRAYGVEIRNNEDI